MNSTHSRQAGEANAPTQEEIHSDEVTDVNEEGEWKKQRGRKRKDALKTPTNSPLATPSKNRQMLSEGDVNSNVKNNTTNPPPQCSAAFNITSTNRGHEIDCHIANLYKSINNTDTPPPS